MAIIEFEIDYTQDDSKINNGFITYWRGPREGGSFQKIQADGRLDNIGSSVTATGFSLSNTPDCGIDSRPALDITIICTRTAEFTMSVTLQIKGNCPSDGYGYGYGNEIDVEKTIDDILLTFN